ncbi:MAG: PocR ligand-binding domain-containing protein [Desulfopila sp.]|jgi:PAS domain S-box-containing protein|nr:PocR ligand-binding domain-containing protein [Desulfopila sp.]
MSDMADTGIVYHPNLQQCRDILDNAPIGIFVSTLGGRFVSANLALARIYGYSSVDDLLASITDISTQIYVDADDRDAFIRQIEEHGELISHQCRQYRRDGSVFWASEYARAIRGADGKILYFQGFTADVSAERTVAEALENRVLTLTRPGDSLEEITVEDLFTIDDLQKLQDQFAEATGVASIITRTDGRPVTRPSNFCRLCKEIIRNSDIGRKNCFHSDAVIGRACTAGPTVQTCLSGGLWDAGAGITVGGKHIANWLIGQVRDEAQSEETIRAYARQIEVDEEEAVMAFREVPSMARERFEKIARMLHTLASQLSSSAYQNVQQARFISERKKSEDALRNSESRLRSVFRSAPVGIGVVADRFIKQVNQRLCEITGYSSEELLGQSSRVFYPDDEEFSFVGEQKYEQIRRKGTGTVETRWRRKDGAIIDILLSSTPIELNDLKQGVTFSALDITERKQNELALRESERKLADYASQMEQFSLSAASMISVKDENVLFAGISQAIVEFSDFTRVLISLFKDESPYREIIGYGGVSPEIVQKLGNIPLPKSWYDRVFAQGQRLGQLSYYIPHSLKHILNQEATLYGEGEPPLYDSAWHPEDNLFVRLNDAQGNLIGVISVDDSKSGLKPSLETVRPLEIYAGMIAQIIVLKREQANRERLEDQLRMAHKMESVGRLAGGIAHDFNNMLGVILGYTEMALDDVSANQPLFQSLQGIQQAAERSADLTRQLLAFARKQTIAPRILDLNDTLESMLTMLQRLIGEDIELVWLPGERLGTVKMDSTQIDQVVVNLCVNARDAVSRGSGRIAIETSNAVIDSRYCSNNVGAVPGDYILLTVSDNGCGMDSETISHLFEPFFTTKKIGQGTGLGLATVYGIVKQNHGFVGVESEPGRGTAFRIYLPRHDTAAERKLEEETIEDMELEQQTILLVEDEAMILEMTRRMLEGQGYIVLSASTPGQAVRIAGEHAGRIALLITDVVMPEMNGRELAKNLLAHRPTLKRLFMSGYTADVIACHGVLDEGVCFIQKPFTKKDLLAKVRTALEQP